MWPLTKNEIRVSCLPQHADLQPRIGAGFIIKLSLSLFLSREAKVGGMNVLAWIGLRAPRPHYRISIFSHALKRRVHSRGRVADTLNGPNLRRRAAVSAEPTMNRRAHSEII